MLFMYFINFIIIGAHNIRESPASKASNEMVKLISFDKTILIIKNKNLLNI